VVEVKQTNAAPRKPVVEKEPADAPVTFKTQPVERKGGERLSAYLAFVPMDVKELSQTRFETYFINDSNYYVRFIYLSAVDAGWRLRSTAEVEPNTKLYIEEFGREDLGQMERVCVQMVAYKRDKNFLLKPTIDVQMRVDGVKFYKLHTFQENDFFEQPAIIQPIVEDDKPARTLVIDAQQLKDSMYKKDEQKPAKPLVAPARKDGNGVEPLVIDLHADEILETTNGMSPVDILNYQLDVFRNTLKEHAKQKGMKIVFIHGKGEGVLRRALINELQYRFKQFQYQDASFQEYGYGATQVTIK
jgi:hypothetical protein